MPLTRAEARAIALSLPDSSERPYFNKPGIFIGENFLARVHDKEDAVALRTGSIEMRDVMLEAEPKLFYVTDHYKNFAMILVRLKALTKSSLKELLTAQASQLAAKPKKRPRKKVVKKKKA